MIKIARHKTLKNAHEKHKGESLNIIKQINHDVSF